MYYFGTNGEIKEIYFSDLITLHDEKNEKKQVEYERIKSSLYSSKLSMDDLHRFIFCYGENNRPYYRRYCCDNKRISLCRSLTPSEQSNTHKYGIIALVENIAETHKIKLNVDGIEYDLDVVYADREHAINCFSSTYIADVYLEIVENENTKDFRTIYGKYIFLEFCHMHPVGKIKRLEFALQNYTMLEYHIPTKYFFDDTTDDEKTINARKDEIKKLYKDISMRCEKLTVYNRKYKSFKGTNSLCFEEGYWMNAKEKKNGFYYININKSGNRKNVFVNQIQKGFPKNFELYDLKMVEQLMNYIYFYSLDLS